MSDIYKLDSPQIDTVSLAGYTIGELDHDNSPQEFVKRDSLNVPYLRKLGNFTSWEFAILKTIQTDTVWNALVTSLVALNDNTLYSFYPDKTNNPSINYKCYYVFKEDIINTYPRKIVIAKIIRYYQDEGEV